MAWINALERLPILKHNDIKRFKVRILVGSMSPREEETVVLGKQFATGFRFMLGDWKQVIEWYEDDV